MGSTTTIIPNEVQTVPARGPFQVGIEAEGQEYGLVHFVARSGHAGREWAADYRRQGELFALADRALKLLRNHCYEQGYALLQEYALAVEAVRNIPDSLRADMWRHYHAVAGYYHYCVENFALAHESMRRANEEAVRAISGSPFLVVLSTAFLEFTLHRARVARNQRLWQEMHDYIELGRAMVSNEVPLCIRLNGEAVFFSSFAPFFEALGPLTPRESEAVHRLVDDDTRVLLFDRFVRGILRLPGFATDWS
ncbi:MAG TPA: hypothetical protein VIB39_23510 [Candidatus Angelobacter sp.]|jgi:hypothetical protein